MKEVKFSLISLIDANSNKLDYRIIRDMLIDQFGLGTSVFNNLGFTFLSEKFEEKEKKDKYSLNFEIGLPEKNAYFLVGENGLFLKTQNKEYVFIESIINKYKLFIGACRLCLFKPIGIIHLPDGNSYIQPEKVRSKYDKERFEQRFSEIEWFVEIER